MSPKAANWKRSANSCDTAAQQLWESRATRSDSDLLHHCKLRRALWQTEVILDVKQTPSPVHNL